MDKDYKNFVDRMHSFDDKLELTEDHMGFYHSGTSPREIVNNTLQHVGIKGMKWHHHKALNPSVVVTAAKTGKDITALGQTISKGSFNKKHLDEVKKLSDEDLKKLTNRLNLENNYINAKQQQEGRDKVERILTTAGSALAVASSAAVLYQTISKFKD